MQNKKIMIELMEGKHSVWLPVLSGSMAPSILPDDEIYIEPKITEFKRGDIVVFYSKGKFFGHRIIFTIRFRHKVLFLEKGDANNQASFISESKALGQVTKLRRGDSFQQFTGKSAEKIARKTARKSFFHLIIKGSICFVKGKIKKCIA
jgi:signal peptidase I